MAYNTVLICSFLYLVFSSSPLGKRHCRRIGSWVGVGEFTVEYHRHEGENLASDVHIRRHAGPGSDVAESVGESPARKKNQIRLLQPRTCYHGVSRLEQEKVCVFWLSVVKYFSSWWIFLFLIFFLSPFSVDFSDQGQYECSATNGIGSPKTLTITVQVSMRRGWCPHFTIM